MNQANGMAGRKLIKMGSLTKLPTTRMYHPTAMAGAVRARARSSGALKEAARQHGLPDQVRQ